MAKRKLKKNIRIFLLLIFLVFVTNLIINNNFNNDLVEKFEKVDYVSKILSLNINGVDEKFLNFVNDNYKESLKLIYIFLNSNEYSENLWRTYTGYSYNVLLDKKNGIDYPEVIGNTITFLGDTSLADNYLVMQAYNERKNGLEGILSSEVIDYINDSSLTIANSEFAFGNLDNPLAGKYYTFGGSPDNVSLFHEMGVDMVTLANNHVYDYGSISFNTTLETFDDAMIKRIGAGKNIDEASKAQYYIINGYKVSFLNANRSEKIILTPGATESSEGVFRCYDPDLLINRISEEDNISDLVVPIIHWGLEGSHEIENILLETGKMYIDAGADAIVGHHAHVLQGIEFYNDKPIIYNIGNFIFDNYNRELGIITFTINDDMDIDYLFLPALQEKIYTDFLEGDDKKSLLDDMRSWSINTYFEDSGNFYALN